jgi:hypothetical protein
VTPGGLLTNLQALETALRYFLLRRSRQDPQFPKVGDTAASETYLTNYMSLGYLIDEYNKDLGDSEKKFEVAKTVVDIRDAFAHGRLLTALKQPPYRLWKFGTASDHRVPIEFCKELTSEWLREKSDMIYTEKEKVISCFNARGYRGLQ